MFGYAAIVIVIGIIGLTMFGKSSDIANKNKAFVENTLPLLRLTEEANNLLNAVHMSAFAFYGTTISTQQFNQDISENREELELKIQIINRLLKISDTNGLQDVTLAAFDKLSSLKSAMTKSPTDWDAARKHLASIQDLMDKAQAFILELKSHAEGQANKDSQLIQAEIEDMHLFILLGAVLMLVIIVIAYWIAKSRIIKPLISLSAQLTLAAKNMDLTSPLVVNTKDELAVMCAAINTLISAFREGTQSTRNSAGELLSSAQEMENVANNAKSQINTFSNNIQNLTGQISTFENNILETASRSRSASETATTGASQVQEGAQNVDQTAKSITRLTDDLEASSVTLLALKASGDQVSAVVSTIAAIAEQTNLLALNAAIEAARAGEYGRGFAVVADEVRLLSTRTHESTLQINQILDTIINAITDSVDSMNSNKSKANQTVELVNQTVNSLTDIQQTILQLSDENTGLATLAEQNEHVIATMRHQVQDVSKANETLAKDGTEIFTSSTKLSALATSLYKVANLFKS